MADPSTDPPPHPMSPAPEKRSAAGASRTTAARNPWPFMILVAVLIGCGWFLVKWMADSTTLQDCVMSGRKNCAPLDPKLGR